MAKTKKDPTAQTEIPNLDGKQTKCQLRALELAQARYDVNRMAEKARVAEQALIQQMVDSKECKVAIRDMAGQVHLFDLMELRKIKHRTKNTEDN